jgi:hypothetical protein
MPRERSKCWFFTAIVRWSHVVSDRLGDEFLALITKSGQCSAEMDMLAFSYDERDFHDGRVSPERSISGIVHSPQSIWRSTVEAWIKDPLLVMTWTPQVHGCDFRSDPQFQKFLAESDVDGLTANLKRRVNLVGNCAAPPPKKTGRPPCPYKRMSRDQLYEALRKLGRTVAENLSTAELIGLLRRKDVSGSCCAKTLERVEPPTSSGVASSVLSVSGMPTQQVAPPLSHLPPPVILPFFKHAQP